MDSLNVLAGPKGLSAGDELTVSRYGLLYSEITKVDLVSC